ncbi:hypothetical protein [Wenyingzhuangia sp. IMCC45574]
MNKLRITQLKTCLIAAITTLIFSCSTEENIVSSEETISELETESRISQTSSSCGPNTHGRLYRFTDLVPGGTDVNKTQVFKTAEIDDRTCHADYYQKSYNGRVVGVYEIAAGTQNNPGDSTQPRIERASKTVNSLKKGSFVEISGYVTIQKVGYVNDSYDRSDMRDGTGTYIIQAKGKHYNATIGSADPAILLLVAKPKFKSGGGIDYFEVYREQITKRGGSGTTGRVLDFVANIAPDTRTKIVMKNYFKEDNQQWVDVTVGSVSESFRVPNTQVVINGQTKYQTGYQAKIRFGAYRCKGGSAEIYWDTVRQTYLEN